MKVGQLYRILIHVTFWVVVVAFYVYFYGHNTGDYYRTFLFVLPLVPITILTTYFLNYYLIPKYLLTKRYILFVIYATYSLVFSLYFELLIMVYAYIVLANYDVDNMNPMTKDIIFLLVGLYFVVAIAVAIKLLKNWYEIQHNHQQLEKEKIETELKLKEAELKLLKGQIHPHFLFNTLNNLYGLTLKKSDDAPRVVILISDLLDYLLYKCNSPTVKLDQEVTHIENYLALEKIRYGDRLKITFDQNGIDKQKIAPMILLPFVENSFKHGVSKDTREGFIHIALNIDKQILQFEVENSKINSVENSGISNGIGLKNVSKRLSLLYPDHYTLETEDGDVKYAIRLNINLEKIKESASEDKDINKIETGEK